METISQHLSKGEAPMIDRQDSTNVLISEWAGGYGFPSITETAAPAEGPSSVTDGNPVFEKE